MLTLNLRFRLLLLVAFLCAAKLSSAQGEGNFWYFGFNAGLDFTSGSPVGLSNGAMITFEGCASISDASGNLLFYTDGSTVFNANHSAMTNGTGLLGGASSCQSAIIVPKPNNPNIYYIFTVPSGLWFTGNGLRYSEVDMSLQSGLGAVTTTKNVLLTPSTSEKITAVRHANGVDYWVVCHSANLVINSFEVTSAGVNTTPVTSNTVGPLSIFCYMKASPDGKWMVRGGNGFATLMEFDDATGQVVNNISLPLNTGFCYGLDFSSTGKYLYLNHNTSSLTPDPVIQYDLSVNNSAAIISSATPVGYPPIGQSYAIQLAPDNKIYFTDNGNNTLGVLNAPDSAGTASNYVANAVTLPGTAVGRLGLPTFIQSIFLFTDITVEDTCELDSTFFSANNSAIDSIFWDFGDTASGANNYGEGDSIYHVFTSPGTYQVSTQAYFTNNTGFIPFVDSLFDTLTVTIHPLPFIDLGNDTVLCQGDSLTIQSANTILNMTFLWSDSSTNEFLPIQVADTYHVEVSTLCGTYYDTIVIDSVLPSTVDLGPDSILCVGDTVLFELFVAGGSYLWQDGSVDTIYAATTTGMYAVTATGYCNTSIDTVNLYFVDPPSTNFPGDTTFCDGQSFDLKSFADSAVISWQDGSNDSILTAATSDTFSVIASNACGTYYDTVVITIDFPLPADLGNDTVLCAGTSFPLRADLTGNNHYLWSSGDTIDSIIVDEPGTFWLEATNTCGVYSDTVEIDGEVVPDIALPERTLLCVGQTLPLEVPFSRSSYLWNTGSQDSGIVINSSGVYKVTVTNLCGTDQDSVEVVYDAPLNLDIGDVYELCEGDSLRVSAHAPNEPVYNWNNGSVDSTYTITEQGYYSVTVTNACGSFSDEVAVYIEPKPKPELPTDTVLCTGEEWSVMLSQFYSGYQWQDGSQEHRYLISKPGRYTLRKWNRCGVTIDSLLVEYRDAPAIDLGEDTVVCPSIEPVTLEIPEQQGVSVFWSDKSEDWVRSIDTPGIYEVTIIDNEHGCVSTDEVRIDGCPIAIWIPSAFTPNSDSKNEVFLPQLDYVTRYNLKVFDRWGAQLFTTINPDVGWDGTYQGISQPEGVYVYILEFKVEGMTRQKLTGAFTLIR